MQLPKFGIIDLLESRVAEEEIGDLAFLLVAVKAWLFNEVEKRSQVTTATRKEVMCLSHFLFRFT